MERVERLLLCVSVSAEVSCTAPLSQRWAALHWSTETEPALQTWQLHRWSLSNTTVLYWVTTISDYLFTPQTLQEDHAYNIHAHLNVRFAWHKNNSPQVFMYMFMVIACFVQNKWLVLQWLCCLFDFTLTLICVSVRLWETLPVLWMWISMWETLWSVGSSGLVFIPELHTRLLLSRGLHGLHETFHMNSHSNSLQWGLIC